MNTDAIVDILVEKVPSTHGEWREAYDEMHTLLANGYRPTPTQLEAVQEYIHRIPDEQSLWDLFKDCIGLPAEVFNRVQGLFGPIPGISDHRIRLDLVVWAPKDTFSRNDTWERALRVIGPTLAGHLRKCHTEHYWAYYVYDTNRMSTLPPPTMAEIALNNFDPVCKHPRLPTPVFDEVAARGLSPDEVRERWPRTDQECPDCGSGVIGYVNFTHYVAGDW